MSGKPAARQGDMTQYGGSIVQGSAGVRIGAPTGVACSVCPGGVTSGHPVNPLLGAKVLPGETDIALPGPLPFILSRTYSSYRTKTPAPVGSLGPGWKMPADIRVETATGELARTQRRSLADALQQSGGEDGGSVVFPPVLVQMLDRLESEILADRVSEESRRWLASCGLTVEQMQNQMDPVYTPARKIHLYHCDHRGLPLALVSTEGATEWCAEYDEWGNLLNEENPHQLQQLIRLPGQQYDEESGLYYNRHRYYDPLQGRYITQDPIGLKGGWNFYQYPLNPVQYIDSMGLASKYGHLNNGGYGARPNKPPTPDPSKLPDIAKQLRLPYPIDQASSAPNVFKTFFRVLSPYDYTLYCRKWVKPNLTCTPQDDSQYPGMDTKTASDYLPQTNWPTTQLPPGYTCAEPYLFPDINKPDGPATAGIDDLGEILAKMKQRTSRGIRK
nr:RHS repeat-associated core domain-containing protein [Escherichia coli]